MHARSSKILSSTSISRDHLISSRSPPCHIPGSLGLPQGEIRDTSPPMFLLQLQFQRYSFSPPFLWGYNGCTVDRSGQPHRPVGVQRCCWKSLFQTIPLSSATTSALQIGALRPPVHQFTTREHWRYFFPFFIFLPHHVLYKAS
jgi:hypothetical protein